MMKMTIVTDSDGNVVGAVHGHTLTEKRGGVGRPSPSPRPISYTMSRSRTTWPTSLTERNFIADCSGTRLAVTLRYYVLVARTSYVSEEKPHQ